MMLACIFGRKRLGYNLSVPSRNLETITLSIAGVIWKGDTVIPNVVSGIAPIVSGALVVLPSSRFLCVTFFLCFSGANHVVYLLGVGFALPRLHETKGNPRPKAWESPPGKP